MCFTPNCKISFGAPTFKNIKGHCIAGNNFSTDEFLNQYRRLGNNKKRFSYINSFEIVWCFGNSTDILVIFSTKIPYSFLFSGFPPIFNDKWRRGGMQVSLQQQNYKQLENGADQSLEYSFSCNIIQFLHISWKVGAFNIGRHGNDYLSSTRKLNYVFIYCTKNEISQVALLQ